ncbi:MAG: glycoside hydrolase family 2 protein [bacterium]
MNNRIDLNGSWEFSVDWDGPQISQIPSGALSPDEWLLAQVPGTVHTDLLKNNKIDDPFYRDNELKVPWVAEVDWIYRKCFLVSEAALASHSVQLVAEGLDTFSTIFVNGHEVAQTRNMFIEHRFEVKEHLRPGENNIKIRLHSPVLWSKRAEEKYGRLFASHENHRVYARKAQYSFGWDWGPKLPTSGIWRPIYIETVKAIRLEDVFVDIDLEDSLNRARVSVQIETEIFDKKDVAFTAAATVNGEKKECEIRENRCAIPFEIKNPHLWWPAGHGEPHLYQLKVEVRANNDIAEKRSLKFGIRKVELLQEKDDKGESFLLKINHEPIFCKGANWIPADSFLPRVCRDKYAALLNSAKDANMNMLRVWGGGIYENEIFYELCDELGLLVWQDFMFACAAYPDQDEFRENVSQEVEAVVRRLRNHAGIVLWCGNNENEWVWKNSTGRPITEMPGYDLFHNRIPDICKNLDASRPYWPSSPFAGDDPNSAEEGNRHQWDIWSRWEDFRSVDKDLGRFITEFGFQAPANLCTYDKVTTREDRCPQSEIMEFHNKQTDGTERLFRFLAAHVPMPTSFDDFIYKAQVVQGEALKHCIEHWRRNKFHTSGALIWQLNDCWPVSSWSLIDSALRPKGAYFYVKRAFAPTAVSLTRNKEKIEVWTINDSLHSFEAKLMLTTLNFHGTTMFSKSLDLTVSGNSALKACEFHLTELKINSAACDYLKAELCVSGEIVAENRLSFKRIKHLEIPRPDWQMKLDKTGPKNYVLSLSASVFAKSVRIQSDSILQVVDNFFDLEAHCEKRVHISTEDESELSAESIQINSLWSAT